MAAHVETQNLILKGTSFTLDDVNIGKPKVNASGGKNVALFNSKAKKLLNLSTPLMLTWGVNENDFEGNGKKTYDMSLQFPSDEYQTESTTAFLDNLKALESHIKAEAIKNSKEWFNKAKMTEEVIDALWTPMVRYPKDKETGEFDTSRSPTLRIKLPFWDGAFNSEIYDMEKNQLFPSEDELASPLSLITKGSNVALVISSGGIWFANGKFGTTWKLVQAVVKPKASLRGKCHIELDEGEQAKLSSQVVDDAQEDTVVVADSEEEEEEEAEPEPEPPAPPAPAKKKRIIKKKKEEA